VSMKEWMIMHASLGSVKRMRSIGFTSVLLEDERKKRS